MSIPFFYPKFLQPVARDRRVQHFIGKTYHNTSAEATIESPMHLIRPPPFQSRIITQTPLLPGLLGLRGYAALAVVLFHLVHIGNITPPELLSFIAEDFGRGVHLFFLLSAFSLMHSTSSHTTEPNWIRHYFIKRFFRIAPLYYSLLVAMILWPKLTRDTWTFGIDEIILNVTFTFGFAPWAGIVWAGWSIGVEMIFYAIFPVVLVSIGSHRAALLLLGLTVIISMATHSVLQTHFANTADLYSYNWANFSFAPNAIYFGAGIYAYMLLKHHPLRQTLVSNLAILLAVVALGIPLAIDSAITASSYRIELMLWVAGLAALCVWQAQAPGRATSNRVAMYLGERSYSIYLIHPVLIAYFRTEIVNIYNWATPTLGAGAFFASALAITSVLLVLSELSYRLVELPFIRLGKRLVNACDPKASNRHLAS